MLTLKKETMKLSKTVKSPELGIGINFQRFKILSMLDGYGF